ncbi:MAG: hypothetical protein HY722_07655 [Planctomycetes bacterium]|nr:hypothetical protein [Planctomycetota bacterium]
MHALATLVLGLTAEALFPLADGARWVYRRASPGGESTVVREVTGVVHLPGGEAVHEVRGRETGLEGPTTMTHAYWSAGEDGVYLRGPAHGPAGRGLDLESSPVPLLPRGARTGDRWDWVERREASGEVGTFEVPRTAWVVSAAEAVEVPAGYFPASLHLRVEGAGAEDLWFAEGVGLVLRAEGAVREALVDYRPGLEDAGAREAARRLLESLGLPADVVVTLGRASLDFGLRSRFCVGRRGRDRALARVLDGRAQPFDPASSEDWEALLADEGLDPRSGDPAQRDRAAEVLVGLAPLVSAASAAGAHTYAMEFPASRARTADGLGWSASAWAEGLASYGEEAPAVYFQTWIVFVQMDPSGVLRVVPYGGC